MSEEEKNIESPSCDACGDDKNLSRIDEWAVFCEDCLNEFKGKP